MASALSGYISSNEEAPPRGPLGEVISGNNIFLQIRSSLVVLWIACIAMPPVGRKRSTRPGLKLRPVPRFGLGRPCLGSLPTATRVFPKPSTQGYTYISGPTPASWGTDRTEPGLHKAQLPIRLHRHRRRPPPLCPSCCRATQALRSSYASCPLACFSQNFPPLMDAASNHSIPVH